MTGVFILTLALFLLSMIRADEVFGYTAMPFYKLIFGSVHNQPVLDQIIALAFMLILGYMLIRIGARYVLLEIRSFMPALFFILFTAAFPETRQLSPALIGSVFYLFSFAILFDVNDKPADTYQVFTAGIVLALGSMFYLKLIWFLPLFWLSLFILRPVTWRELLYPVIAYFLMALFLFTWFWAFLDNGAQFTELIRTNLAFDRSYENAIQLHHYSEFIYFGFFLLLVAVASIYMIKRFQTRKNVVQDIYQVQFFMFLTGLLFFGLISRLDPATLVFITLPTSFVLSNFFHRKRNPWIHELLLWIVIGLLVFVQVMTLGFI